MRIAPGFALLACLATSQAFAEGVGVNATGATPDPSAMLDVSSTTAGVLVPRMTEAERNAIPGPATGLLIYQTDIDPCFYYYDGSGWQPIGCGLTRCPAGFTAVNASYCIETNERVATTWWLAVDTCTDAGYQLCAWEEWYGACTNGVGSDMTGNQEWVADGSDNISSKVVGQAVCEDAFNTPNTGTFGFRCCHDLGTGGVGRGPRPCPPGYTAVNDDYCIQTDDAGPDTWLNANDACMASSPGASLCSGAQWSYACASAATLGLVDMTDNNSEWMRDWVSASDAAKTGFGGCTSTASDCWNCAGTANYRCCFDRQ